MDVAYTGCGRRNTGEWCFKDGFINFDDIISLYNSYFKGRALGLVSDCSYAGNWVQQTLKYLETHQISPCLHSARAKETLISVYSSCHSHQIPYSLLTPIRGWHNDKNTGYCLLSFILRVAEDHSTLGFFNTEMICRADKFESNCLLPKGFTCQKRMDILRLETIKCSGVWKLFLVIDDPEILHQVAEKQVDINEYGLLLKSGQQNAVMEWLDKEYPGHCVKQSQFQN